MRVVGGAARGRKLKAPHGRGTRPTSDKVRESIFDMLPRNLEGYKALDLFAGSGAMGIEALSRGAGGAVFVESNPAATKVIKENLKACGFTARAKVTGGKLPRAVNGLLRKDGPFGVVFIDPPYEKNLAKKTLRALAQTDGVRSGGLIIVEHFHEEEMPARILDLRMVSRKKYGSTAVTIYEKEPMENAQENEEG